MRICFSIGDMQVPFPALSSHFGEAGRFWVWDEKGQRGALYPDLIQTCRGPCRCRLPASQEQGFDAVICRAIGHRALLDLRRQGVQIFHYPEADIQEALQLWREGRLSEIGRSACLSGRRTHGSSKGARQILVSPNSL